MLHDVGANNIVRWMNYPETVFKMDIFLSIGQDDVIVGQIWSFGCGQRLALSDLTPTKFVGLNLMSAQTQGRS